MLRDEKLTYFVDRSLGSIAVAKGLRAAISDDESVETHDDLFPQDTDDDVWLSHVGKRGWIALSKDDAIIRKNAPALVAVVYHQVRLFVLTRQDMKGEHMGRLLAATLPRMRKIIAKFDAPFIAQIAGSGLITGPMTEKRIVEMVKEKHGISI